MKIISLNIWGGILRDSLLKFLKKYSSQVDFFCFQEVYSSPLDGTISKGIHLNIFEQISNVLSNHIGYFAPSYKLEDIDSNVSAGLAIFVNKSISIKECNDTFIYGGKGSKPISDCQTAPRNLQFITFESNKQQFLFCHFHGIWYPKTKNDTSERLIQSKKIKNFLSKYHERLIVCGDFNLLPDTKSMSILENGMRNLIKEYNIKTTRNNYYKRGEKFADYILISADIQVKQFEVLKKTVSDHLPLLLEI